MLELLRKILKELNTAIPFHFSLSPLWSVSQFPKYLGKFQDASTALALVTVEPPTAGGCVTDSNTHTD